MEYQSYRDSIDLMDSAIQTYCGVRGDNCGRPCDGCKIDAICDSITGEFGLKHAKSTAQAFELISKVPENWCCTGCMFENCELDEYPCTKCKANTFHNDPNYKYAPYLFMYDEPMHSDEPIKMLTEGRETTEPVTSSPVNHPSHYNQGGIECIDAMVAAFGKEATAIFCKLNAFKYVWRADHKNGIQDIEKTMWYLDKYRELSTSE